MKRQILIKGDKVLKAGKGLVELPGTRLLQDIEWPEIEGGVALPIADVFWDGVAVRPQSQEAREAAALSAEHQRRSETVARNIVDIIRGVSTFDELKAEIENRLNPPARGAVGSTEGVKAERTINGIPVNDDDVFKEDDIEDTEIENSGTEEDL